MAVRTVGYADFIDHLHALGVQKGDDLFIQSRLFAFGRLTINVEEIYQAIREVVGERATIIVPTHRYTATADEVFDRHNTPSQDAGVLSEYVRKLPGAIRSNCPMHSHAAVGPKASMLNRPSGNVSFGPGSDFEVMLEEGVKNLLLGCDFTFASFVFHVLAVHGAIPYRTWLDLPRKRVTEDGEIEDTICRYYGRIGMEAEEDQSPIGHRMLELGLLREQPCPYGISTFASLQDIYTVTMSMVRENPEVLILRE